jgi:hypothetical protein
MIKKPTLQAPRTAFVGVKQRIPTCGDAGESVSSVDDEVRDLAWLGDRFGQ